MRILVLAMVHMHMAASTQHRHGVETVIGNKSRGSTEALAERLLPTGPVDIHIVTAGDECPNLTQGWIHSFACISSRSYISGCHPINHTNHPTHLTFPPHLSLPNRSSSSISNSYAGLYPSRSPPFNAGFGCVSVVPPKLV